MNRRLGPRSFARLLTGISLVAVPNTASAAIAFGQLDDFQDGSTQGWGVGIVSPNPPTNVADAAVAGNRYVQNISTGGGGAGSKQAIFNTAQWAGDFNKAGVNRVEARVANLGNTNTLYLRAAIQGGTGSTFASTSAIVLPPNAPWTSVSFDLSPAHMTLVNGSDSLTTALGKVTQFRLLSAGFGPSFFGDSISNVLGMDDVRALRLPGDATFDGKVDFNDLVRLAQNYNVPSGRTWNDGDFNFDGAVDFNDLVRLAQNYNTGDPPAGPVTGAPADFAADLTAAFAAVPEPGGAGLGLVVVAIAVRRGRRRPARC